MLDEELKTMFRTVADHMESLAISIQNVEDLQEQDRTRMEADRARMDADHSRLDRLERLFKLMARLGDRERKELRERINAMIDAQMRSEAKMEMLNEKMQELSVANTLFQAQVGVALSKLADATAFAHQRLDVVEAPG